ncbi:hypothetical protein T492DRAFT_832447 [Pavlovales sp. CCMP2436]|nr:hypothetical protein T492DRAFT_832447 [Pavlovales sp. CCMP2436]
MPVLELAMPFAQAAKLARVPLPPDADDGELLATIQRSLQLVVAEALRALRAHGRAMAPGAAALGGANAAASVAHFLLAASSASHRQSAQLRADLRSVDESLASERTRRAELVLKVGGAREAVDYNARRAAALRASEAEARESISRAAERAQDAVSQKVEARAGKYRLAAAAAASAATASSVLAKRGGGVVFMFFLNINVYQLDIIAASVGWDALDASLRERADTAGLVDQTVLFGAEP